MEKKPNYYTILPAEIRYDNNLTPLAKLLLSEILTLSMKDGYCYAANSYFAKVYNVSKDRISKTISKLVKQGYLSSEIQHKENTKKIIGRYIKISDTLSAKITIPIVKNNYTPIVKNNYHNNINKNNTNNNINNKYYSNRIINFNDFYTNL